MERFESQTPGTERTEKERLHEEQKQKIQLTWNALQLYHAHPEGKSEEGVAKILKASAPDFRGWFNSVQGALKIDTYAREHTPAEIESFKDMDELAEEFEAYLTRIPRTLH